MRSPPLPRPFHLANEGLAFLLELVMLAALAWWGAEAGGSLIGRVLLGVAAPLAAAVIWGLCAAPRARFRLPMASVLAVKAALFVTASVALYALGRHWLAICCGVIALINSGVAAADRAAAVHSRR